MFKPSRMVYSMLVAVVLGTSTQPLAATTVQDCYEKVLAWCVAAMEDANWLQKFAIGELCTGMLVGCTGANVLK